MRVSTALGMLIGVASGLSAFASGAGTPKGWMIVGTGADHYTARVDTAVVHSGRGSGLLECPTSGLDAFGALMQVFLADDYRGRRIRLSGYLRTREPEYWAAHWMRVDGKDRSPLAFDNMTNDRLVRGDTEWTAYQIVLDVPVEAVQIAYGATLAGSGRLWVDDLAVEVVGDDVPTTDLRQPPVPAQAGSTAGLPRKPFNGGFEE